MLPVPAYIPEFTAEPHAYYWQGVRKISVTQLLEYGGLKESYPEGNYRERGTAVHYACELIDRGRLDIDAFYRSEDELPEAERISGYVQAYQLFLREFRPMVVLIEQAIYSPLLDICGTLDRGLILCGRGSIVDLKTGTLPPSAAVQTAAYGILLFNAVPTSHIRRYGLQLKVTGKYKLAEYVNPSDYEQVIELAQDYRKEAA